MDTKLRAILATSVIASVVLLAGGCAGSDDSGGSGGSTATGSSAGKAAVGEQDLAQPEPASPDGSSGGKTSSSSSGTTRNAVAPLSRAVISTGEVSLHTKDVSSARADVLSLVSSWGGTVADEQTQGDRKGRTTDSTLTLRVPTSRFDTAMNGLARVGEVAHQSRSSEDVTTQVIDNDARVRAAQRSIRAIEGLLARATRLSDVISIESDLARRQADLDSLEQQQAWLADQTSLSTITVHLTRTTMAPVEKKEARGFLSGLDDGWTAMRSTVVVALTALGAVLPFALLVLVVGVPLWVVVRRRRPAIEQS